MVSSMWRPAPHGRVGVAVDGVLCDGGMLRGRIPCRVRGIDGLGPSAVQAGAGAQRGGDGVEARAAAAGQQHVVELLVDDVPLRRDGGGIGRVPAGRVGQGEVGRHQPGAPGHVVTLDASAQGQSLDVHPRAGEVEQVVDGDRRDLEADLRAGLHQALLGQPAQHLAGQPGAGVVALAQHGELQPLARREETGEDVGPQPVVHLVRPGLRARRHAGQDTQLRHDLRFSKIA
nr:hypothetical protein [Kutzneria sp. 744]